MGSVDPGYGTAFLARVVGEKKAREIWYLNKPLLGARRPWPWAWPTSACRPRSSTTTVQEWAEDNLRAQPHGHRHRQAQLQRRHRAPERHRRPGHVRAQALLRHRRVARGRQGARRSGASPSSASTRSEALRHPRRHHESYVDEDLAALAEHARRFCHRTRSRRASCERDHTRVLDRALMREMGEMGFIAPELSEAHGGQGLGRAGRRRDPRGDRAGRPEPCDINLLASLNGQILVQHGRPGGGALAAAKLTRGEALLADRAHRAARWFRRRQPAAAHRARTATTTSSTARRPRSPPPTRPMPRWCSAAPDRSSRRRMAVTALLVPMDLPGVTRNRFDCHGQRAIGARLAVLRERARVPAQPPPGRREQGLRAGHAGLRLLACADRPAGAGRRPRGARRDLGVRRAARSLRQAAVGLQGVSHPLADFDTQVEAARLLCLQTLWLKDKAPHTAEAAMCKWWAPKLAYDAIHQCLLMFGHGGYDRGADGAAPARRAGLPDRRRHGPDHENHHRPHARRTGVRAFLRPAGHGETAQRFCSVLNRSEALRDRSRNNKETQGMDFDPVLHRAAPRPDGGPRPLARPHHQRRPRRLASRPARTRPRSPPCGWKRAVPPASPTARWPGWPTASR